MRVEKIRGHEQAQCRIIYDGSMIYLQSYDTIVLEYNTDESIIYCSGRYSMTTIKHIGWFMGQVIGHLNYHDMKDAYLKDASLFVGRVV